MKIVLVAALLTASPAIAASPIEGRWTNPHHSVTVRIAPCREALCGRVVSATAKARADAAAGGTPRLIGTELMSGLIPAGGDGWHGTIFVPDANRRAEADLHLTGPSTLEIQGCALGGLVCKSQQWTRVSGPAKVRRRR